MVTLIIVHIAKKLARFGKEVSETWREARRARRSAVPVKQIKLPSDSVRADLCLGLTVTGLYTLTTMGLIIVFM